MDANVTVPTVKKRPGAPDARRLGSMLARAGALPFLIAVAVAVFQFGNARFLTESNIVNIVQQTVFLLLVSLGQMLVLLSGGFDLSVGSNTALTSIVGATAMVAFQSAFPDLAWGAVAVGGVTALGVGLFAGLVNGVGVAVLGVNPFIVTLATASIFQGLTLLISQGLQVGDLPEPFVYVLGSGFVAGVPVSVLLTLPVLLIVFALVGWTRYGRYLYTVGSNARAALIAGVSVRNTLLLTYVLCAVITSFSAFLLTARVSSGEPQLGGEFPLRSITAAVIGGCSLRGGQGTVTGVLLGAVFITILSVGMDLLRLGSNYQMILVGLVLVGAVLLDRYQAVQAGGRI